MAQNWTTADYYNPFPGIEAGLRIRGAREAERSNRSAESRAQATDARSIEEQKMRQAEALSRMGVDPIPAAGGGIDWQATGMAARKKIEVTREAEALAQLHAWAGVQGPLSEAEAMLSQTPEYQRSFRMASTQRAIKEAERAAQMEQIGARGDAALKVAEQRGENASRPTATVTRELPDGSTVRIPVSPEEAMQMGKSDGPAGPDKWDEAIEKITRFRDVGQPIDVEIDDDGFPKVSKSRMFHDASPGAKGSYDAQIEKIIRRSGKKGSPQGAGGKLVIQRK